MDVCEQIKYILKSKELTQRWLAKEMDVDEKTLSGKLSRGSISAEELLLIGRLLDIDLNKMKEGKNIMFEWLKEKEFITEINEKQFEGSVVEVNKDNMLVAEGYFEQNYEKENDLVIVKIFNSNLHVDFDSFDDWENRLYNKFVNTNQLVFNSFSTQTGDSWVFELNRVEYRVNTPMEITVVNYVLGFCGEIKGEIISFNKKDESKEQFVEWIMELAEGTELFNYSESNYKTLNAITYEESQISQEEHQVLSKLFEEA